MVCQAPPYIGRVAGSVPFEQFLGGKVLTRYPVQYELEPTSVAVGLRWLTLRLKNVGDEVLVGLDVKLNSLDTGSIYVYGRGIYLAALKPGEEVEFHFQVSADSTGSLYVALDGMMGEKPSHWESLPVVVEVGLKVAELVSLFAMTPPYPLLQETIRCEAVIRGLAKSDGLELEFLVKTPSGALEELAVVHTGPLSPGEEAYYTAEVSLEEKGPYTLYAYLYAGPRRLGRRVEYVYVRG
jgi:hypothetical protein